MQWIRQTILFIFFFSSTALHASDRDAFFKAIAIDDTRTMVNLLFGGFNQNITNSAGIPGLVLAIQAGSIKTAELLISLNKTKIEMRTPQDESALMMAALHGHLNIAKKLIQKGADVTKTGWTPLHYAATNGEPTMIRLLLDHFAYIDAESPNKSTPLMMAAGYSTLQAVKMLVENGADIHLKNDLGLTALDFALQFQRTDVANYLRNLHREKPPKSP